MTQNLSDFFSNNAKGSGSSPGTSLSGFFDSQAKPKTPAAPQGRVSNVSAIIAQEGADHLKPVIEAIYKQESGAGSNARTSIDGAQGGMQVIPATFQRYAKPGERIDNPDDNMRVGVRIIKDLARRFGNDPAKIVTGYFSGEGNVNTGQGSAWKNDRADGNGKRVSGYVADILAKVGGIGTANAGEMPKQTPGLPDLSKQPKWRDIEAGGRFQKLPDAEKQALKAKYFDELIAPHAAAAGADLQAERQKFMATKPAMPADNRSTMETVGDTARNLAAGVLKIGPTALKGAADVANMLTGDTVDLGVSKAMKTGMDAIDETVASQRFNDQKKGFKAVMQDQSKGIGDMFAYMLDNPAILVDNTITTVGSMFLPAGAAKGAVMGTKALGMGTAAASKAAVAASIGTSAAQNAADTFSTLDKQSLDDRYKGAAISAGVSILTGIATGGGAEGQIAKKLAGDLQAGRIGLDAVKRFLQSVGKEGAQEAGEELGNIAGEATGSLEAPNPTNAAKRTAFAGTLGAVMGGGTHVATNIGGNNQQADVQPQAEPTAASVTPDGRIESSINGDMPVQPAEEAGAPAVHPTTQTADDIVRGLAAEAGIPLETVLPTAPAANNEARAAQLWMKAGDGTITPDEQTELNDLQQAMAAEPAPVAVPSDQSQLATQGNEAAPEAAPVAQPEPGQQFAATTEPGLLAAQESQSENGQDQQLGAAQYQDAGNGIAAEQGPAPVTQPAADPAISQAPAVDATLGQQVHPETAVTPQPRTEKEARALRAKQQEISNATQAAEAALPAVQEEARQESPLPEQVAAPKTEREAREQRRKTDILTPDGKKVSAQWDVVEADSIKASLKEGVSQPRDRTRAASNVQVLEIAGNPDFERLSDTSKTMDYGAPTLSADGLIVAGNGRFEGVSRAYDGPTATAYRAAVEQAAPRFGLDADAIRGMKKPVLVRRITDNADTRQLAIQSNQAAGLQMSDMEQAALDSERMKSLEQIEVSDTGDIPLTSRNMQAIQQTLGGYATNELAGMMTADGGLSQSGMRRLRNAILFSAYGKSDTLARLIESPDADMKNVGTALVRAAGKLAKVRTGIAEGGIPAEFDIASDLTAAIETLSGLRAEGKRLDEFLAQGDMFGGGLSQSERAIIQFLADNLRSAKAITEGLAGYAERLLSTQNSSGGLFGDAPMPTKTEVLNDATKRFADERAATQSQQSIFDQPAPELHADTTGGNREVQAGESGNRPDTSRQSGDEAARESEGRAGTDAGNQGAKPPGVDHASDFALRPVEIAEHLISTGDIKALYRAAGVKTADAFDGLPMDKRSAAYAKFIENGGKPAPAATEAYNDKVARQEREALIRRLQSDATVRQASGKPFKTEASAKEFSAKHELDDTHEPAKVEAGYVLKRLPEARRPSVLKAQSERLANDPEHQRQEQAFARAAKIGAAASDAMTAYENGDTSIEQFEAALAKAEKVGAGETAATDAVTQAAAIEPAQPQVELLPVTEAQAAQAKAQESKIGDMGRKVIVRKDTATPTGPRAKAVSTDERPAWMRKYHAMEVTISRSSPDANVRDVSLVVDERTADGIVAGFVAAHPGVKGMIHVVADFSALPENVQQDARDQGSGEKDTKGAFDHRTNSIYIVRDNHTSAADFEETVFHEALGHVGMRTLLGRGFVQELNNLYDQFGGLEGLAKIARARGFDKEFGEYVRGVAKARGQNEKFTLAIAKMVLAEEVFAHAAEQRPKLLDRLKALVGMLRQNLRDLGFKRLAQYGETDLLWMLQRAKVKLQSGKADGRGGWTVLKSAYGNGNGGNNSLGLEGGENTPAWDAPPLSRMDKFIYEMQDRQINLKRVQQAIAEVTEIPEQFDAYQKEELYHGRVASRTHKFLDREVRPLLMDMKLKGIGMDELEAYLWARHAKERNAQIAKINPDMADGGSGLTDAQVDQYMAGADVLDDKGEVIIKGLKQDDKNRLEALAARVDAINAGTKQVLLQYGLESPDTIAAWERTYKNYVPLHREDMEGVTPIGMGFSVKGAASKRAMGSQRKVTDVLAHLALQREAAITRGEKNRVGLALYGLALQNKNADFWEVDKAPMIQHIDKNTGLVTSIPDPTYKNKPNVLVLRVGGQDRAVVFNEHNERAVRAVEVLKSLDVQSFGEIMGALATATRYLAAINTQYNPVFGLVNGLRDVQAMALNLTSTPLTGHTWQVLKAVPSAMRAIWQIERHGKAGNDFDALYEDMQMTGGTTGYREIFRMGADRAKALQQEFNTFDASKGRKAFNALLEVLDHYNTAIENGTRLAAYKVAMEHGMTKDKAASVAKNITVNFNRKGKMGREAGAFYAFFNAAVQGTARTLETLKGPAGKRIIMAGVALGVMQALVAAAGFDDDEWEDIPEFLKQRNFIIPTGNHTYLMFPMPLGFNILPNLGRIPTELALNGGRKIGTSITDLLTVLVDAANPLGSATLVQMIAPTVVDPIVALAENKDFAGFPIAKEDTNPLQPTPGFSRAKDTSSHVARGIAKGINYATGGTKYTPGLLSPTPDQIDYIFGTLTGGAGRELNKVYQSGEMLATGKDIPESKKPVVGRFFGTTDDDIAVSTRFWTNVKDLNSLEMEIKGRAKDGEDPVAFIQKHPEAGIIRQANRFERQISKMRTERHRIEFDEKITEKERTAQLLEMDANITKAMGDFNAMAADAKKRKP
jgi:hypothetical protein